MSLLLLSGRIPIHLTSPNSGPLSLIHTILSFSLSPDSSINFCSSWYKGESLWMGMDRSEYWRRFGTSGSLRTLWIAANIPQFWSHVKKRFFLNTPSQVPFPLLSCENDNTMYGFEILFFLFSISQNWKDYIHIHRIIIIEWVIY